VGVALFFDLRQEEKLQAISGKLQANTAPGALLM